MPEKLRGHLFDAYDGFADSRYKKLHHNKPFRVDDFSESDVGNLFCHIFVYADDNNTIRIEMRTNVPRNEDVENLLKQADATTRTWDDGDSAEVKLEVNVEDTDYLRRLSYAVRGVVAPGAQYPDPNWKWLAPRTASSLEKLADVLDEYDPYMSGVGSNGT